MRGAEADTIFQNDFDLLPKLTVTDPDARRRATPREAQSHARRRSWDPDPILPEFSGSPILSDVSKYSEIFIRSSSNECRNLT